MRPTLMLAAALVAAVAPTSSAAPATRPVDAPALGVAMVVPDAWTAWHTEDKAQSVVRFTGMDEAKTALALIRRNDPVPEADRAEHVRRAVERHRESAVKNRGNVVEERDVAVAGTTGRLIEVEAPAAPDQQPLRFLVVCFLLDGREYKLMLAARQDAAAAVRPAVNALVESIRPKPGAGK